MNPTIMMLIALGFMIFLFVMFLVADKLAQLNRRPWQEASDIRHYNSMLAFDRIAKTHSTKGHGCEVEYIVAHKDQPFWNTRLNRITIAPFRTNGHLITNEWDYSAYTKSIKCSTFFYMQLRGLVECETTEKAREALRYLNWQPDRELPEDE